MSFFVKHRADFWAYAATVAIRDSVALANKNCTRRGCTIPDPGTYREIFFVKGKRKKLFVIFLSILRFSIFALFEHYDSLNTIKYIP